jgi:MFS family permease
MYAVISFTRGVFLTPITNELGWTRGTLSGAFSIFVLVAGPLAIFTGKLTDKYGPRFLITVGGVFSGIGFFAMSQVSELWQVYLIWVLLIGIADCSVMTPTLTTIPKWFTKRRGMALGITTSGFALGGMLWPPIAQTLISSFNWSLSYLILGGIILIFIVILGQFMKHSPQRIGLMPYGQTNLANENQSKTKEIGGLSFSQAIRTRRFWFFSAVLICFFFFFQIIVVHIIPHAIDIGISPLIAATILSLISAVGIASRLSMGFIADRIGGRLALIICLILQTVALVWLLVAKETWMLYLFAIVFGIGQGGIMPIQMMVTAELFGLKSLGMLGGALMLFGYSGMALGPILAGIIFDAKGSYDLAFIISIILGVVAILMSILLLRSKIFKETSTK